jgi:hypothetical protein
LVKIEEMELIKPKNESGSLKPMNVGQGKFRTMHALILKFAKLTAL